MKFKLEICSDSMQSSLTAQEAGASRIELCDNLPEGGTTPGYGTIMAIREKLKIGMNVLIRPRGGDFLYSDDEFDIMCRDIDLCKNAGVDGIVIGILTKEGEIDVERTAELVLRAGSMSVTFHRAFDMCKDPVRGLEDIIRCGAERILTSGQANLAVDGLDLIAQLNLLANKRIIIMPGSGLNETNIADIALRSGAGEFHLSARKITGSEMEYRKEGVIMGGLAGYDEFSRKVADGEKIRKIVKILEELQIG
jgi:copper homeostasis protein